MDEDDVVILDLELIEGCDDGAGVAGLLAACDRDQCSLWQVRLDLAVLAGALEVAGVYSGCGELASLADVRSVTGPPGVAGLNAVGCSCCIAEFLEGVAPVAEVLRPCGDLLKLVGFDLGAVLLALEVWTLLTKVETSCDRILIAGGANVEAEWEQGPAV